MIRIGYAILAFFTWQASTALAGEIQAGWFYSKALGRNMPYMLYLPDGYASGVLRYPSLYLLHGAGGDEHAWPNLGNIKEQADSLIHQGAMPPAIIVMPGCPACWWVDGAKEQSETAFWSDLVPFIDGHYRTLASRGGRLVAGLSAGGYGAIRYALRYPDQIAAAAALSPAVYTETVPLFSAARSQPQFLTPDGHFDRAAWDRQNYPALLDRYLSQPYRVPLYLIAGNHDRLGIAKETERLFKTLGEHQREIVEFQLVDGDHSWKVWEPAIGSAMRFLFRFALPPRQGARTAGLVAGPSNR